MYRVITHLIFHCVSDLNQVVETVANRSASASMVFRSRRLFRLATVALICWSFLDFPAINFELFSTSESLKLMLRLRTTAALRDVLGLKVVLFESGKALVLDTSLFVHLTEVYLIQTIFSGISDNFGGKDCGGLK